MRTCHLKDSQILLNQKSRHCHISFSTRVAQDHLFYIAMSYLGGQSPGFSCESSPTIVESLQTIQG